MRSAIGGGENPGEIIASGTVSAVGGDASDAVTVSATLNEHVRLPALLKDAIGAMPASGKDCWVGMGVDEVVVRGESSEAVMAGIEAGGTAGCAVVLEFVIREPQVIIL